MKLSRKNIPFTQVSNDVLTRKNLSWAAKGMYGYLFSKPSDWDFSAARIASEGKGERKLILRLLKELEESDLLVRRKQPDGRMEYELTYSEGVNTQSTKEGLRVSEPEYQNGTETKGHGAHLVPISNIYSPSNKEKESNKGDAQGVAADAASKFTALGADVIKAFEAVDPKNKRYYNNTSQRAAADFLVSEYGFELVKSVVGYLPKSNKIDYLPTVTTPCQLVENWVKLEAGLVKLKRRKTSGAQVRGFTPNIK